MNVADLPRKWQEKIQINAETGCWEWVGARTGNGYGSVSIDRKARPTHRVIYEALVGPIPDGLQIDHLCRVRHCCHPSHLEPVTAAVNVGRKPDANKAECVNGHAMTPENTVVIKRLDGYMIRNCRTCKNDRQRSQRTRPMIAPEPLAADAPQHGSTHGYSYYKCRCADCRRAFATYMAEYRRKRAS